MFPPGSGVGAQGPDHLTFDLADASKITDAMVSESAYALADYTMEKHGKSGLLYPPVSELRDVSLVVAARVIQRAFADGVARSKKVTPETALDYVKKKAWKARYLPFERA